MNAPTYMIERDGSAITCLRCGRTSHNPNDVKEKYCSYCKLFHEGPPAQTKEKSE
jgi:ribosomal protein L37E